MPLSTAIPTVTPLQIQARAELERRRRQRERLVHPDAHLSPADRQLKRDCTYDVALFAQTFLPHLCPLAFSSMHQDFFARYASDADARGLRDATAAPRSFAKTTVIGKIKILHDCVYQHERYIVIISSRDDLAIDKVKDVREELESNTRLQEVYGPQVGTLWNMGDFITAQGVRVRAAARGSQVRGLLWGRVRPSKIVLDDSENSEHVLTEMQRQKMWAWYTEDITKLGDDRTNIEVIGTILHDDSLLAKLLRNPGYRHRRYQAVLAFADAAAVPLWQQWRTLFLDLDNPRHQEDALAFYEAHEREMTAGAEVLWPERYSYYQLMVERLVDGNQSFMKERQNMPQLAGDTLFDMEQAGYFTLTTDRLLRHDGRSVLLYDLVEIVAYWDPAIGQGEYPDWSSCVVVAKDGSGYLYALDAYMSQGEPPERQLRGVAELVLRWSVQRLGLESNLFQILLKAELEQELALQASTLGGVPVPLLIPVTNTRNKMVRISTMESLVTNRHLWFNEALHPEALRQMRVFRPVDGADRDDFPDSLDGGVRVMKHLV